MSEKAGEWVTWAGGECPVSAETLVDVMFRDGLRFPIERAGDRDWTCASSGEDGRTEDSDIIAYRIVGAAS